MGATTETELEDCQLQIEDAKNATFAAIEEGIVLGGSTALVHLSSFIPAIKDSFKDPEEMLGADIVQMVSDQDLITKLNIEFGMFFESIDLWFVTFLAVNYMCCTYT